MLSNSLLPTSRFCAAKGYVLNAKTYDITLQKVTSHLAPPRLFGINLYMERTIHFI